jgi:hypothetical protein
MVTRLFKRYDVSEGKEISQDTHRGLSRALTRFGVVLVFLACLLFLPGGKAGALPVGTERDARAQASNERPAIIHTIDFSVHGQGVFESGFYKKEGVVFTQGESVGFIQGDEALVGPIAGAFMPPAANLSVRVAPALQGTAEYTLTAYDGASRVIALRSVVVTEDTGDPATISFGYFTLELDVLSGGARYFSVTNRFIRSSFSEITSIPFGVSSLTYSTPMQTH